MHLNILITYPHVYWSGVRGAKVSAFAHWRRYKDWERKNNETYVFSVARDASLAGGEVSRPVCTVETRATFRVQRFHTHTPIGVYYRQFAIP